LYIITADEEEDVGNGVRRCKDVERALARVSRFAA
jgi:hypothetical protein